MRHEARGMRTRYCGTLCRDDVGAEVALCGWVARRREHGEHLAFVDLRDHTGIVQCVVDGAHAIRPEYVLRVVGIVRERPEGTVNPQLATGEIEVADCEVEVLAASETPPFQLDERAEVDEALRLRYRYLDLRTDRMQKNLRVRAAVNAAIRRAMDRQGFVEIETPLLWTPTPEGAREFAVPSRLQKGSFYALPQSPQIAKQLLMIGGVDRYYQIARCMRDEDPRADRQFEFTQLDVEASFVSQDDVLSFVTEAISDATEVVTGTRPGAFTTMTWSEAIDRYGSDKPDLRFGMEISDLSEVFAVTEFKAFQREAVRAIVVDGGGAFSRARLDGLIERAKTLGAGGLVWMRVHGEPPSIESPIDRFLTDDERKGVLAATGASAGALVLVVADERRRAAEVLGQLRLDLGRPPIGEGPLRYCWVVDFPLFDGVDEDGNPAAAHHPFTMPYVEDLERITDDPFSVRAHSYDLVVNGWELGSGSIRVTDPALQRRIFDALGITPEVAEARFGFLLDAYRYGGPPHGGFAVGIDRLVAVLVGEESIREVIAFPKTQSGADLMTGGPLPLPPERLAEIGVRIDAKPAPPGTSPPKAPAG